MTPEQFKTFLESNEKATATAIEKYVNGGIRAVRSELQEHIKNYTLFQQSLLPMIEVFKTNNIVRMRLRDDTSTIVFYAKSALTIGALITAMWGIIKWSLK